eukprot:scaffold555593_cov47-Attheya_sp.AAC.1
MAAMAMAAASEVASEGLPPVELGHRRHWPSRLSPGTLTGFNLPSAAGPTQSVFDARRLDGLLHCSQIVRPGRRHGRRHTTTAKGPPSRCMRHARTPMMPRCRRRTTIRTTIRTPIRTAITISPSSRMQRRSMRHARAT